MKYAMVVAATENNVIGIDNKMPWHLPEDLKFFKQTTLNAPIIMGKNTWVSIGSKPLPKRLNIVISRTMQQAELPEGVLLFNSFEAADAYLNAQEGAVETSYIIGGGQLYKDTFDKTDIIYRTLIHANIDNGMVFFPEINNLEWQKVWEAPYYKDERHAYDFTFEKWIRIK